MTGFMFSATWVRLFWAHSSELSWWVLWKLRIQKFDNQKESSVFYHVSSHSNHGNYYLYLYWWSDSGGTLPALPAWGPKFKPQNHHHHQHQKPKNSIFINQWENTEKLHLRLIAGLFGCSRNTLWDVTFKWLLISVTFII
jgi:ABC-type nickel/cobalt efflux system permease component RcnA